MAYHIIFIYLWSFPFYLCQYDRSLRYILILASETAFHHFGRHAWSSVLIISTIECRPAYLWVWVILSYLLQSKTMFPFPCREETICYQLVWWSVHSSSCSIVSTLESLSIRFGSCMIMSYSFESGVLWHRRGERRDKRRRGADTVTVYSA